VEDGEGSVVRAMVQDWVKETNLFLVTDTVPGMLPKSPVVVLIRAPIGIASSFARGRLWDRWRYGDRYAQADKEPRPLCGRGPEYQLWWLTKPSRHQAQTMS